MNVRNTLSRARIHLASIISFHPYTAMFRVQLATLYISAILLPMAIGDAQAAGSHATAVPSASASVPSPEATPPSVRKDLSLLQGLHDLATVDFGVINIKAYGAKGDCQTDDTAAFMRATEAAYASNLCLYLPPSCYRVTQLNWTDLDGFCAFGTGPGNWRGTKPHARTMVEFVNPKGLVGLDTSGSSDMYLAGIELKGGTSSPADAPRVLWLHGKDATGPVGGEAIEGIYERMVFVTFGPFGDYNVGNEQIHYVDSQWISSGVAHGDRRHGTRMQVFSTVNSFGVHSPWVTLRSDTPSRWTSMTSVDIDGFGTQWTSNGDYPVTFDNAKPGQKTAIARIKLAGYVQLFGPNDIFAVDSMASGARGTFSSGSYLDRIDMDLLTEFINPGRSSARLIDVKSTVRASNIKLDMGWPGSSPAPQPYLSFGGFRDSTLQLMPNVFISKPVFSAGDCQGSMFIGEIGPSNINCSAGKYLLLGNE